MPNLNKISSSRFLQTSLLMLLMSPVSCKGQDNSKHPRKIADTIYGLLDKPKSSGDAKDIEEFKKLSGFKELEFQTSEGNQFAYAFAPITGKGSNLLIYLHGRDDLQGTAFDQVLERPESIGLPNDAGRLFVEYSGNLKCEAKHEGPNIQTNHESVQGAIKAYEELTGNPVNKIIIFGQSIGDFVALKEALDDDRVIGVILAGPLESVEKTLKENHAFSKEFDPAKDGYDNVDALSQLYQRRAGVAVNLEHGSKDKYSTPATIAALQKANPKAIVTEFPGVEHAHLIDDPKKGAGALAEGLKKQRVLTFGTQ